MIRLVEEARRNGTIALPMRLPAARLMTLVLLVCLVGCGKPPLQITTIQLGRSLNADQSVSDFTTIFAPNDTVHLSVLTTGGGSGTLGVKWTYRGTLIGESEKRVENRDFAATDFPLRSAGGFPHGDYNAEVFLDGKPVGAKPFKVQLAR